MADKKLGVKVELNPDKRGLKELDQETKRTASSMKAALGGALSEGLKGGTDAVKGLLSDLKKGVGQIGGLLGGLGAAELARGAIEAKSRWSALQFQIKSAGGTAQDFVRVQERIQKAALTSAQDSMKMVDVFDGLRQKTGSVAVAADLIEDVGTASRGAHKELEQVGKVSGALSKGFGIKAGDEMRGALADVVGLAEKGGGNFEQLAASLESYGAIAKQAGLQGREGLAQYVGLLNVAARSTGSFEAGAGAMNSLVEQLSRRTGKYEIAAKVGISTTNLGKTPEDAITGILRATGGNRMKLERAFQGDQLKVLLELGKTYAASFEATKGDVRTKTAAASDAVRAAFTQASKSAVSWADISGEAAKEMESGPAKIAAATERLRQAVAKPEVVAGIEKMLNQLPKVADVLAKVVGFAADNPAAAGAAVLGGTFAKGAIESMIVGAFQRGGTAAAASIGGALTQGSGGLVSALGGFGPAVAVFAIAAAAFYAASEYQAKKDAEKRKAEAEDAQRMLKGNKGLGGAYQVAGALEAATGQEFDPNTAISDATAAGATSGQDDRDRVELERAQAKAALNAKFTVKGVAAERLLAAGAIVRDAKGNAIAGGQTSSYVDPAMMGGRVSGMVPPPSAPAAPTNASGAPNLPGLDPNMFASLTGAATANALGGKVLQVRVVGDSGPTGAGPVGNGNAPR